MRAALAAAIVILAGACGPAVRVDFPMLKQRIDGACAPIHEVKLRARVRTDVPGRTAEVRRALDAGDQVRADALATATAADCSEEAERRRQLAPLIPLAAKRREVIPDEVWHHFLKLVADADYTNAIVCGESLAQGSTSGCDLAPARQRTRSRTISRDPPPPQPRTDYDSE